jgi:hypothetical protein
VLTRVIVEILWNHLTGLLVVDVASFNWPSMCDVVGYHRATVRFH